MRLKILSILLIAFTISGCANNDYVPNDEYQEQMRERNLELKEEINTFLVNTSLANYDFEYVVTLDKDIITYKGAIYDNITKGTYIDNETNIDYQIENDVIYNLKSLENNINIYSKINNNYIYLNKIKDNVMTKKAECEFDEYYACITTEDNIKLSFWTEGRYINKIEIIDNDNTYILNYSNYNRIEKIPSITFQVDYQETNDIRKASFEDEIKFNVIFYKIDNIKYIINNKTVEFKNNNLYLDRAIYVKDYLNNDNAAKPLIRKYAFSNDFIIIFAKVNGTYNYYLTLDKYANEILEQIPINDTV